MRRPLESSRKTAFTETSYFLVTPFTWSRFAYPQAWDEERFSRRCEHPLLQYDTLDGLFQTLGFPASPLEPKWLDWPLDYYPRKALPGQHPKWFLQWGAQIRHKGWQTVFEMGNASQLVSLTFCLSDLLNKKPPWQLDKAEIIDGGLSYFLDCDVEENKLVLEDLLETIKSSAALLNNDDLSAEHIFQQRLRSPLKYLEHVKERSALNDDYAPPRYNPDWSPV